MNIEQLKDQAETIERGRMPCLQVKAILALAEQVERIADLLENIITTDVRGAELLNVFVEMDK